MATDASGAPTSPDSIATILPSDLPAVTTLTSGVNAIAATVQTALTNNYLRKTSGNIVNADINASAAIAYSKVNLANSIVTGDIVNGTILNADISASAAITPNKVSGAACQVYRTSSSGAQSFAAADGTWSYDTILTQTATTIWSAGAPTRFTAPYAGVYNVYWAGNVAGAQSGSYGIYVRKNGATNVFGIDLQVTSSTTSAGLALCTLAASDYLELIWTHGTSTGMSTAQNGCTFIATPAYNPFGWFGMNYLGA